MFEMPKHCYLVPPRTPQGAITPCSYSKTVAPPNRETNIATLGYSMGGICLSSLFKVLTNME